MRLGTVEILLVLFYFRAQVSLPKEQGVVEVFAFGVRYGVGSISFAVAVSACVKEASCLLSFSQPRLFGCPPNGVISPSCWASHSSLGFVVAP
jgi:hypothetical protein